MTNRQLKSTVNKLADAAKAIVKIDPELFHAMAVNGCDVVLPQQLVEMASRLLRVAETNNGYSSRKICQEDNPGQEIWRNPYNNLKFVP